MGNFIKFSANSKRVTPRSACTPYSAYLCYACNSLHAGGFVLNAPNRYFPILSGRRDRGLGSVCSVWPGSVVV